MGFKYTCTHYKLCSVQSKLMYFSQFWGMKHFLGPVCDIRPQTKQSYELMKRKKKRKKKLKKELMAQSMSLL